MNPLPLSSQLIYLCAALMLLLSFAMIAQRRVLSLVNLLAMQGATLAISTMLVAYSTGQHHLYYSVALTFALKVFALPWILHRLIRRLDVRWDTETLVNIPTTMLIGILLVIFSVTLLPVMVFHGQKKIHRRARESTQRKDFICS